MSGSKPPGIQLVHFSLKDQVEKVAVRPDGKVPLPYWPSAPTLVVESVKLEEIGGLFDPATRTTTYPFLELADLFEEGKGTADKPIAVTGTERAPQAADHVALNITSTPGQPTAAAPTAAAPMQSDVTPAAQAQRKYFWTREDQATSVSTRLLDVSSSSASSQHMSDRTLPPPPPPHQGPNLIQAFSKVPSFYDVAAVMNTFLSPQFIIINGNTVIPRPLDVYAPLVIADDVGTTEANPMRLRTRGMHVSLMAIGGSFASSAVVLGAVALFINAVKK